MEFEAMGDDEAGERAAEIFDELRKGSLEMDDIEITQNTTNRMDSEDLAERKAEARGQI
jgi:predicted transcriptional regulator